MENVKNKGTLIAVGGGESQEMTGDTIEIFERFIAAAGGAKRARVVLMTVATDEPEEAETRYSKIFEHLKFKNFEAVNVADRLEAFDEKMLEKIESASGLYFTGGDQLHVMALAGGTPLHRLISEKFRRGLTVGGTSAGAMMMSPVTLVSGQADCVPRLNSVEVAPGMDLLADSMIDTHFSQRGRHGRLLSAIAHNPQVLGFGIDERTAMIVAGDEFEVVGEGAVTVVDAGNSRHTNLPYIRHDETIGICGVNFHVLPRGYKYDLKKREPRHPPMNEMIKKAAAAAAAEEEQNN